MTALAPVLASHQWTPPGEKPIETCGVFPSLAVAQQRVADFKRQRPGWDVRFKEVIREVPPAEYKRSVIGCELP